MESLALTLASRRRLGLNICLTSFFRISLSWRSIYKAPYDLSTLICNIVINMLTVFLYFVNVSSLEVPAHLSVGR